MDVLSPPAIHDSVLNIIFRFFKEETELLTHREITYRLFYRLIGMSQTIPGIADVSRTKLRGVLALLKTLGCEYRRTLVSSSRFYIKGVCMYYILMDLILHVTEGFSSSKEGGLTVMGLKPELKYEKEFRWLYDLGE